MIEERNMAGRSSRLSEVVDVVGGEGELFLIVLLRKHCQA